MKRSTKIISAVVLSISLVTAAGAYATYKQGYDEMRASFMTSYISGELDLNEGQVQQLKVLSGKVLSLKNQFKAQGQPMHQDIEKLLTADTFDQQRALGMIGDKTAFINREAPQIVAAFADFFDGLNTEQKAQVMKFLAQKHQGGGMGFKHH